jgi:DNA repair exonuclease SbcCD ATPase subunit
MRLLKLEINNCFKYGVKNNRFDFTDNPLTLLVGPNGAGKSSIFDAICFALFEKTIRWGSTHDEIIRRGSGGGHITLLFEKNEREYEIMRGRSFKKTHIPIMSFQCITTGEKYGKTKADINKEIINIIGMDFDAFRNSVLFGQEDVDRIISLQSKDRLTLLSKFLGIDFLDKCHEATHFKLTALDVELQTINEKIDTNDKRELKKKIAGFKELRKQLKDNLSDKKQDLDNYSELFKKIKRLSDGAKISSTKIKNAVEAISEWKEMLSRLKKKLKKVKPSDIKRLEERYDKAVKQYELLDGLKVRKGELNEVIQELREELAVKKSKQRDIKTKIAQIKKKEVCAECESEYTDDMKGNLIEKQKEKGKPVQKKIDELNKKIASKKRELKEVSSKISKIESLKHPEILEGRIREAKLSRKSETEIAEIEEKISKKQFVIRQQKGILDSIKEEGYSKERLNSIHERMLEIQDIVSKEEENLNGIREGIKQAKTQLQSIKDYEEDRNKLEEKLTHLKFIRNMFSKTGGMRQIIIENVLPVLNSKINRYLDALTQEPITVEFTTGAKTKAGKYRDKLDILIWSPEGSADFLSYSGGEKREIVLSIGLGLAELASESVGAECDFLLLDEVFGSLDKNARNRLVNLLYALQKKFKNVIVISHLSELRTRMPKVVTIKRRKQLSAIIQ